MPVTIDFDDAERGLAAVLWDVKRSTDIDASGWLSPSEGWTVSLHYDDSSSSTDLVDAREWSYERFVSVVADWVQTKLEFHLRTPWPSCPHHRGHELRALTVEGYWVCPTDQAVRFQVGELP